MVVSVVLVVVLCWVLLLGIMVMVECKVGFWVDGQFIDLQCDWCFWEQLLDSLKVVVIVGEDQYFVEYYGFDLLVIQQVFVYNECGGSICGVSMFSQQVVKNVFFWFGCSWLCKGLEVWFILLIEMFWIK